MLKAQSAKSQLKGLGLNGYGLVRRRPTCALLVLFHPQHQYGFSAAVQYVECFWMFLAYFFGAPPSLRKVATLSSVLNSNVLLNKIHLSSEV